MLWPMTRSRIALILTLNSFWAVFWVDVNDFDSAQKSFIALAKQIGKSVESLEEARQVLANADQRWLLILDNADDVNFDYQIYFPSGVRGAVIMTSRLPECQRYATVGWEALPGLDEDDSLHLLLQASAIPTLQWAASKETAGAITKSLWSHPLAILQAGAYISRGHCSLDQYLGAYNQERRRLLQFLP